MPLLGGIYSDQIAFHIIAFLKESSVLPVKGRVVIRSFVALGYLANDVERTLLETVSYTHLCLLCRECFFFEPRIQYRLSIFPRA